LSEEQIFELVHRQLAAFAGVEGEWTVARRTEAHTDAIFHEVLVSSLASDIVIALREARVQLEAATAAEAAQQKVSARKAVLVEAGQHTAIDVADVAPVDRLEPAAFGWEPAPITVWADLRRPVTGEIPQQLKTQQHSKQLVA
jgi:hypothetical protein